MTADLERARLLYKIAKAYYEDDLTQQEIGKRLGLSRIKISRLLRLAREARIVQITITPPEDPNVHLEREVESRFGLDEVIVVSPTGDDTRATTQAIGAAAAGCLARALQGTEVVTLSWGSTLLAAVEAASAQSWSGLTVVQCLGGLGQPDAQVHGMELVRRLAQTFGARPRLLPAPGIVASKMVRDALVADAQIADALALAARADVALLGIGVTAAPDSVVRQAGTILTEQEIEELEARGAVGDIALRFFDAQGQSIRHEINDRVVGLELEQIRRIPRVIGAAGGAAKVGAIRGALRGKLINVLVTDDRTARRLLAE